MTTRTYLIIFTVNIFFLTSCIRKTEKKPQISETKQLSMDNYKLSAQTAHPKAKKILTEDFYWSPIEETGPFGNDDGSDAFYGFRKWRMTNKNISPLKYIDELLNRWNYPSFNMYEMDTSKIKDYVSANMGNRYLLGYDDAIIAVGFGQFVLEGKIDEDICNLTKTAIKRELLPILIDRWGEYKKIRIDQLNKMLIVIDKMNE